jgi:hypothetical protein
MPRNLRRPTQEGGCRAHAGGNAARHSDGQCHRKQTARLKSQLRFQTGKGEKVGQEPTAPSASAEARKTPSGARPNRGPRSGPLQPAVRREVPGTGC